MNNIKIAVLTLPFNVNYGGVLQAYALMEYLKRLGHSTELLFVQMEGKPFIEKVETALKRFILKYILQSRRFYSLFPLKEHRLIEVNIKNFADTYIGPRTAPIYNEKDFMKIVQDRYDAYIVGSDQVWKPKWNPFINHAFFDFVKNNDAVLLSYAASFGVDKWEYTAEETASYKEQIKRFKGVSMREDSGVELCKEYFDRDAEHVLDPTLLLTTNDYRELTEKENEKPSDGALLCYILDRNEDKDSLVKMVSNELDLDPFSVNCRSNDIEAPISDRIYPPVTSWLRGFDDAEFVITDSFHGCIFSILFNKPFIVYGNEIRGMTRFTSLLKMFDLESRLIYSTKELAEGSISAGIDWEKVNDKLEEYRKISRYFLQGNLG
jgi:hypothetical protein